MALALTMSIGAWAQGHQRYTSAVNLSVLQAGDTLAEGASITFDITGCTTWSDIIARNPGVIWVETNMVVGNKGVLEIGSNLVSPSSPYTPSGNYQWESYPPRGAGEKRPAGKKTSVL